MSSRRRKSEHSFSQVPKATIPRSTFVRSHGYKTCFDSGLLVPFFLDEILPGDTFRCNVSAFARLNTPVTPIMDNMYLDYFFFFVPNRLVWNNWQRFMGERDPDPDSSTDYTIPTIAGSSSGGFTANSQFDYMGVPPGSDDQVVSALPFRAYNLIWNEWFRDQNMQDSETVVLTDTGDSRSSHLNLFRRGKRHDYFTSCLPWPQKGPGVELPLGDSAPVKGIGAEGQNYSAGPHTVYETGETGTTSFADARDVGLASPNRTWVEEDPDNAGFPGVFADLSSATGSTINSMREAFQLQKLLERDARGGTRYVELIKSHFGVTSPDFRLQRPEYLGGGTMPVIVNPVSQTSATDLTGSQTPVGSLAAYGTAAGRVGFTKSFVEHGHVIGLVSARADLSYQQGLHRMFTRSTKYDYFWPALAHLGEQAVYNKEIYAQGPTVLSGADIVDDLVFGYQERHAEYRYHPSMITGIMRSTHATSLDFWHLAQEFLSLPGLNDTFIGDDPPVHRVVAVNTEPDFLFDAFIELHCARPMPVYSVPGMLDHF